MEKAYQGKRADGRWEPFMWDNSDGNEATAENTGYEEIEEITSDSTI